MVAQMQNKVFLATLAISSVPALSLALPRRPEHGVLGPDCPETGLYLKSRIIFRLR
jgi:hypothetical protein